MSRSRLFAALLVVASAVMVPASSAAEGEAAQDSVYFSMESEGASIGWMSLLKTSIEDGNVRYHGSGVLQGTTKLRWQLELTGDLTRLIRVRTVIQTPEREIVSSTEFKEGGGKPDMTFAVDGQNYPYPVEKIQASAVYVPQMIVPALGPLSDRLAGEDPKTLDVNLHATNGAQAVGLRVQGQTKSRVTVRGEEVPVRTFLLTATHAELPEPIEVTLYQRPDGTFFGVQTGGMNMFAVGGGAPASGPATSAGSEIVFVSGDVSLAGTLVLPAAAEGETAAPPAVLMLAGPSRAGRDATNAGFPLFAHIAEGLGEAGVASLRYDRRPLDGGVPDLMSQLAADGHAALRALRARPEVDSAKVLLLGHGEGAMLLGEVAKLAEAEGAPVAGLVFLGAVTVKGSELHAVVPRPHDATWLESFLAYDPRANLQGIRLPMLLLHGELDTEVPPDNATGLRTFMNEAGHMSVSCTVAKNMNHYLQSAETGTGEEYAALKPVCAKGIVKRIASFAGFCTK
ncbi:lysophospholipase [bacterium]|nr:lysophospholipase [bacterium]MBU1073957.1 lysophospholipase [bacterium]